jgi:hypothetical protein
MPFDLHPGEYVEAGFLMAQPGDEHSPEGFHHPIAFLQVYVQTFLTV